MCMFASNESCLFPFQPGQCSTTLAYHIDYHGIEAPEEFDTTVDAYLYTAAEIMGEMECDSMAEQVTVMACDGYQIYKLEKGLRRCDAAICTQCE